jgi:hypothetical protein
MERDRQLVHFQALAVAKRFPLKSLQFLPNSQKFLEKDTLTSSTASEGAAKET